jgi:hypothetical protein
MSTARSDLKLRALQLLLFCRSIRSDAVFLSTLGCEKGFRVRPCHKQQSHRYVTHGAFVAQNWVQNTADQWLTSGCSEAGKKLKRRAFSQPSADLAGHRISLFAARRQQLRLEARERGAKIEGQDPIN